MAFICSSALPSTTVRSSLLFSLRGLSQPELLTQHSSKRSRNYKVNQKKEKKMTAVHAQTQKIVPENSSEQ